MHNMIEMTKESGYWTPELLSQSLLGIWFAASHQPWMNLHFVIVELCNRQDWQVTLRQEIEANDPQDYGTLEGLPLLDAFIKETIRVKPLDTRTMILQSPLPPLSPPYRRSCIKSLAPRLPFLIINSRHSQKSPQALHVRQWRWFHTRPARGNSLRPHEGHFEQPQQICAAGIISTSSAHIARTRTGSA